MHLVIGWFLRSDGSSPSSGDRLRHATRSRQSCPIVCRAAVATLHWAHGFSLGGSGHHITSLDYSCTNAAGYSGGQAWWPGGTQYMAREGRAGAPALALLAPLLRSGSRSDWCNCLDLVELALNAGEGELFCSLQTSSISLELQFELRVPPHCSVCSFLGHFEVLPARSSGSPGLLPWSTSKRKSCRSSDRCQRRFGISYSTAFLLPSHSLLYRVFDR